MAFTYSDRKTANLDPDVSLADALEVVRLGRELLRYFERFGTATNDRTARIFGKFVKSLYGAGFVVLILTARRSIGRCR
jgi:hypothetical protein